MERTLYSDIEEFLILGPDLRDKKLQISDISCTSSDLLNRLKKKSEIESAFHQRLLDSKTQIDEIYGRLDSTELFQKEQLYIKTNYKLQLTVLAKALRQLENCENVNEIPNIILSIKDKIPDVLLERSNINKLVNSVVQKKKAFLLNQFQASFERQLTQEAENNNNNNNNNNNQISNSPLWERFLENSRDWLLSYSLVCILPATLTNASDSFVLSMYQEALDTALTPIWGRLFFHLQISRESKSMDQLLWSFHYAKSFVAMLLQLCTAMTSADSLQTLLSLNYHHAFQQLILTKSLKFMKAHIAMVLEEFDLWSSDSEMMGLQVVEEMFDFDEWLFTHHQSLVIEEESGLCSVFYESKENFHAWMLLEQRLLQERVKAVCGQDKTAFKVLFQQQPSTSSSNNNAEDTSSSPTTKMICCYEGLYINLTIFLLARERYHYFPAAAQYLLSDLILEPILCLCLGLLLYHIRSNVYLYDLSVQSRSSSNKQPPSDSELTLALATFNNSVHYFQSALGKEKQYKIYSNIKRYKNRWSIVQNWMPKIFIGKEQQQSGFALSDLLRIAWKTSDRYQHHHHNHRYEYRNEAQSELYRSSSSTSSSNSNEEEVKDIEESVVMTRGLAITLVNVLENQIRK